MPRYSVPSQDELPASIERPVLPGGEDYVLKVLDITPNEKKDYNGNMVDVLTVKFAIASFADGEPLEDINGKSVESEPWAWKDIDPKRMGFKTDGTASLGRQFFCAINGISDLTQRVPEGDTDDLVGRTIVGTLNVFTDRSGNQRNRIVAFKTPSRRRGQRVQAQPNTAQPKKAATIDDIDPAFRNALGDLLDDATPTEG